MSNTNEELYIWDEPKLTIHEQDGRKAWLTTKTGRHITTEEVVFTMDVGFFDEEDTTENLEEERG